MYWPEAVEWLRIHQAAGVLVRLYFFLCSVSPAQLAMLRLSDWKSSCPWEWRGGMSLTHFHGFQLLFTQTYAHFDINIERKAAHRFQNQNLEILLTCPMPLSLRLDWNQGISTYLAMLLLPWLNCLLAESQVKLRVRKIEEEKRSIG